ncbi:MAG TPA: hypothetical protein VEJ86_04690, partial [Candidatus Binataceae bacterium]|nr:hypothetical protein [Candidatus Binataceae bacterium]
RAERSMQQQTELGGTIGFDWVIRDGGNGEQIGAFSELIQARPPAANNDRWSFIDGSTDRWAKDAVSVTR